MASPLLNELILIITAAFIGGFLARTCKLPAVLGYIVSGIVFGILGKHYFNSYTSLLSFSQLGVSLLLFTLGFEISLDSLLKINKKIFFSGFLQIILSAFAIFPLVYFLGVNFNSSLLFAAIFSFSSTAVIVKMLEEKGILNEYPSTHVFIYLLIQDICIVPVIFFMPIIFSHSGITSSQISLFFISAVKPLILFILLFIIGKYFLSGIIKLLYQYPSHELTILATIFLATISIGILKLTGVPDTIAAFLAGVLISEQGQNLAPLSAIRPFRDLLLVLFFVITGMLLNPSFFIFHAPILIVLTLSILIVKLIINSVVLLAFDYSPQASVFISSHLANIGEFALVLGQIAYVSRFITSDTYNILLSIFVCSLFTIPFATGFGDFFSEHLIHFKIVKILFRASHEEKNSTNKKLSHHVIICGHGKVGSYVRKLLELAHIPYIVIDFDKSTIAALTEKNKNALFGDPSEEEVLKTALIDNAKALVLAISDTQSQKKIISYAKSVNPHIIIVARTQEDGDEGKKLSHLGIQTLVVPEYEAGIVLGKEVLSKFDVRASHISSLIKKLKDKQFS